MIEWFRNPRSVLFCHPQREALIPWSELAISTLLTNFALDGCCMQNRLQGVRE